LPGLCKPVVIHYARERLSAQVRPVAHRTARAPRHRRDVLERSLAWFADRLA
jgi:hypothetical protein